MSINYLGRINALGRPLPFYSFTVPAGFPSPAQDHIERDISLDELLGLRLPQVFLARVGGDSMKGVGIFDGDLVVVDRSVEAKPGMIVIAALNNEPLIKTLCKEGEQFILRSENAAFAPRYVLESDELLIWGAVLYSIRSHSHARA
ncbi:translesion error-prone DNA polymerase V autoproteolytic subunit [Pseudomonas sp. MS19]|uniref:LexA family protein n=1 Tax=Pseudomonas sp. MS19 TaxID=2579939 RepID=UPI0015622059|nr:translesion error-prone DNA polymerase V autoproteolytic subunit [Pseudomonas sp. MS19]NRH28560.1 translesion error-prone DNA polymerase V autoproteolytic subunit [Pseudomonas sp. MS19]